MAITALHHPPPPPTHPTPHHEYPRTLTCVLLTAVFAATLQPLMNGYFSGVVNNSKHIVWNDLAKSGQPISAQDWGLVLAMTNVGGMIGSLLSGPMAKRLGPRVAILINNIFYIAGSILFATAINLAMLCASRVLVGVAASLGGNVVSMYVAEISPNRVRGALGVMPQLAFVLGILISNIVSMERALSRPTLWRILYALPVAAAVLNFLLLVFLPESPRFLASKHRAQDTENALQRLRGCDDVKGEVETMMGEKNHHCPLKHIHNVDSVMSLDPHGDPSLKAKTTSLMGLLEPASSLLEPPRRGKRNSEPKSDSSTGSSESEHHDGESEHHHGESEHHHVLIQEPIKEEHHRTQGEKLMECFHDPSKRTPILIAIGLAFRTTGMDVILAYSTDLFKQAGMQDGELGTIIVGIVMVLCTFPSVKLVEWAGRRPLLLYGYGSMAMYNALFGLSVIMAWPTPGLVFMVLAVSAFSTGCGPVPSLLVPEILPTSICPIVLMVATLLTNAMSFLTMFTFPAVQGALNDKTFFLFACSAAVFFFFCLLTVPETKGKSKEEIRAMFENGQAGGFVHLPRASHASHTSASPSHGCHV